MDITTFLLKFNYHINLMKSKNIISISFILISLLYNQANATPTTSSEEIWLSPDDACLMFETDENKITGINLLLKECSEFSYDDVQNPFNVIFISPANKSAQFHSQDIKQSANKYLDISLIGNFDFFKNNSISQLIIQQNNKTKNIFLSQEKRKEIETAYNKFNGKIKRQTKERSDFNRLSLGYDLMYLDQEFGSLKGINLQYMHGFRIAKVPLFVEFGVGVSYNLDNYIQYVSETNFYYINKPSEDFSNRREYKELLNSLSVRIPINLSYRIKLNKNFSIQPYTGINFKINPIFDYNTSTYKTDFYKSYVTNSTLGEKEEHTWYSGKNNIFQVGWQIGLGINISKLYLGIQYGLDFKSRAKINYEYAEYYYGNYFSDKKNYYESNQYKLKSSQLLISIGLNI